MMKIFLPKIKCQTNLIYCQNYSKNKLIFNKRADSRVNSEHPTPVHYGAPSPVQRSAKSKIKMKSLQSSTFTALICLNLCVDLFSPPESDSELGLGFTYVQQTFPTAGTYCSRKGEFLRARDTQKPSVRTGDIQPAT